MRPEKIAVKAGSHDLSTCANPNATRICRISVRAIHMLLKRLARLEHVREPQSYERMCRISVRAIHMHLKSQEECVSKRQ